MFIGLLAFTFLFLENKLSALLWTHLPTDPLVSSGYKLLLVAGGTFLLLKCQRRWGTLPQKLNVTLAALRTPQGISGQRVIPALISALVILLTGAGVGPEAALLSAVVLSSVWESEKLRFYYFNFQQLQQQTWSQRAAVLLAPHRYLAPSRPTPLTNVQALQRQKKFFYGLFIVNGLATFSALMRATDQPAFITKIGLTHWVAADLLWVPLLVALGVGYGRLLGFCGYQLTQFIPRVFKTVRQRILVGSLVIIVVALWLPDLLFSGQHAFHLLTGAWLTRSSVFLTLMALSKLLFMLLCVATGWIGGDIFPIIFAAITQGLAVTFLLPQVDHLLVIAVISVSMAATLLQRPVLASILLALFFPVQLWPVILVTLCLLLGLKKLTGGFLFGNHN